MAGESFVLRVFNGERELTPSTSSIDNISSEKIDSAIERIFYGKYQRIGEPELSQNGEVRVKVVSKSPTLAK